MTSEAYQRLLEKLWAAKDDRIVPVEVMRSGMEAVAFPVADDVEVEPVHQHEQAKGHVGDLVHDPLTVLALAAVRVRPLRRPT